MTRKKSVALGAENENPEEVVSETPETPAEPSTPEVIDQPETPAEPTEPVPEPTPPEEPPAEAPAEEPEASNVSICNCGNTITKTDMVRRGPVMTSEKSLYHMNAIRLRRGVEC